MTIKYTMETQTITVTFCECAENHVGMEKIGVNAKYGYDLSDLLKFKKWFNKRGAETILYDLNYPIEKLQIYPDNEAYLLVIKNGINFLLENDSANDLFNELASLSWDQKAFMYGRVVNKHARHNLCFADEKQDPAYHLGKGRIIAFDDVHILRQIRDKLYLLTGEYLIAEGNYYYDIKKCGIGYHGDAERKKVIGIRLGAKMPLSYQWYQNSKPIGKKFILQLQHGDLYIMSEKAVGNDWKKKSIYTLRHAAGSTKFV